MKETTKIKEVEEEIAKVREHFKTKYGVELIILSPADNIKRLTIPETGDIVKRHYNRYTEDAKRFRSKNKSRREDLVIHHQALCKICKDFNYGPSEIGRYLKKDHTTVIYSVRKANDLISVNDSKFLTVYNSLKKEIIDVMYGGNI